MLVLFSEAVLSVHINEIMYNPAGTDSNKEFIEIYYTPWTNLTDYYISDGKKNESLILININKSSNYSLIIEDDSILNLPNVTIYVTDSTLGDRGLNNDETVFLFDNLLNLIDSVKTNSSIANNNGYSMEYFNGSFYESIIINGTPGYENSISQGINLIPQETKNIVLKTYLDEIIYINLQYTKLFKIEIKNKDNCSKKDLVTVSYNITNPSLIKQDEFTKEVGCSSYASTGEFISTQAGNYTLCGTITDSTVNETYFLDNSVCMDFIVIDISSISCNLSINVSTEKFLYTDEETIHFYNNLDDKSYPYIIEYWIEDLFGNIIKKKINTTNTNKKSYSPSIDENDLVLLIKNKLYPFCNDKNVSDNSAEKLVIVKRTSPTTLTSKQGSTIDIEKFVDLSNKAKFGQTIRVKANIYKGNTRKNLVKAWIENDEGKKVSKESKINVYTKYTNYALTIPIQINPNCNYEFDDDSYKVFIEGLDAKATKTLEIEDITNSLCDEKIVYKYKEETAPKYKGVGYELINFPKELQNNEEFKLELRLTNNEDKEHTFDVWSYVYRGKKSYSGEREGNKIHWVLPKYESKTIILKNKVENAEPGDYKLKIKIKKDEQKTNKEITEEVMVIAQKEEITDKERLFIEKNELDNTLASEKKANMGLPKKEAETVYESSNIKLKKLIPVFIISLLVVFNIVLVWKR